MPAAVSVERLTVSYYDHVALRDVGFTITSGTMVGIVGPNGAGKSTLMKAMLGLVPVDAGRVVYPGKTLREARKTIAYVPQRRDVDWDFPIRVIDTVLLGTYPGLGWIRRPGAKEKALAYECLREVGMADLALRQIGRLSGGQQQRVFIARALAQRPEMFFLDEPFAGIDAASEEAILRILQWQRDEGKTVLVVHHDLRNIRDYFDDVLLLNRHMIGFGPVEDVFSPDNLAAAFPSHLGFVEALRAGVKV